MGRPKGSLNKPKVDERQLSLPIEPPAKPSPDMFRVGQQFGEEYAVYAISKYEKNMHVMVFGPCGKAYAEEVCTELNSVINDWK